MKRRTCKSILSLVMATALAVTGMLSSLPVRAAVEDGETAVAEFNGEQYASFEEAYEAFKTAATSGTITLLTDAEIAYSRHDLDSGYLKITSTDPTNPCTLSVAENENSDSIDCLFYTKSGSQIDLDDVIVDGTNLDVTFNKTNGYNDHHLYITDEVTMKNFTKQIKAGNGFHVKKKSTSNGGTNSIGVLHLVDCNTTDDYLIQFVQYAKVWGQIDIVNSSAALGVIGVTYEKDNYLGKISTDGQSPCDIYQAVSKNSNTLGVDGTFDVTGNVKATVKEGAAFTMGSGNTPNFVDGATMTITYGTNGTIYADGTVVVYGNSVLTEDNIAGFVCGNDGYNLVLNEEGNLVLEKIVYPASLDGVGYASFEEAYNAFANAETPAAGTITLGTDVEIAYTEHTLPAALTIVSEDAANPCTMTIAAKADGEESIGRLFNTTTADLILVNGK
ncbi:MAG: hypothetical protein ACI4CT_08415 [Lachnospiraceae bacterium]